MVLFSILFVLPQWFFKMLMTEGPEHFFVLVVEGPCIQGFFIRAYPKVSRCPVLTPFPL